MRRSGRAAVFAAICSSALDASAQTRGAADLELFTIRRTLDGAARESVFTMGGTVGVRTGNLVPYVGAALGFFTVQARAGIALFPAGLLESGLMLRIDVRPQVVVMQCWQPAVLGQVGIGYRWSLEYRRAGEEPGAGFYVLPAFEAGPAWLRNDCGKTTESGYEPAVLLGGTVVGGMDW